MKNNISELDKKYFIYTYVLGNGEYDWFWLDKQKNKKSLKPIKEPMKIETFSIKDGLEKISKTKNFIDTSSSNISESELAIIKDFYKGSFNKDLYIVV